LPRGGKRSGSGRPLTGETIRKTVSWRLPVDVLTRVYKNADLEGITVTAWVERALVDALKRKPRLGKL
jgi:hypothetical protein